MYVFCRTHFATCSNCIRLLHDVTAYTPADVTGSVRIEGRAALHPAISLTFLNFNYLRSCDAQVTTSEDVGGGGGDALATAAAQRRSGVVVFVKDPHPRPQAPQLQQQRHLMQLTGGDLVTDSASNTDSGNGTSEYSDDPSPPLINSTTTLRHCSAAAGETPSTYCISSSILIIRRYFSFRYRYWSVYFASRS